MLARDPHVGAVSSRTLLRVVAFSTGIKFLNMLLDIGYRNQLNTFLVVFSAVQAASVSSAALLSRIVLKHTLKRSPSVFDFLTKDMGEDRWLCTLLIKNGWRLEYCAISKNETFCPVNFHEFFKQRRRWIPSTVANLWLLVSSSKKVTHNKSINYLFILIPSLDNSFNGHFSSNCHYHYFCQPGASTC